MNSQQKIVADLDKILFELDALGLSVAALKIAEAISLLEDQDRPQVQSARVVRQTASSAGSSE